MEIRELKKGDIFEVIRNSQRYKFVRMSLDVRPVDFFATNMKTGILTPINMQTKIRAVSLACGTLTPEDWYFTFGRGQPNQYCYHKIHAHKTSAEDAMNRRFGKNWSMMYSAEEFKGQAEKYNLEELK